MDRSAAIDAITSQIKRMEGELLSKEVTPKGTALYASFAGGQDRTTFYFPADDNLIHYRSERPDEPVWDQNINRKRLLDMKLALRDAYTKDGKETFPPRVLDLGFAEYQRVGRNEAGQITAEREAME